ncbi:MAG: diacylglycerol O-acyltransferase 1 [Chrysothrix sp. TS-e1954]|nr:MAG: diacylglycerol O-acyltransferase 1 [Chrysothrix sp. TS-e1954]
MSYAEVCKEPVQNGSSVVSEPPGVKLAAAKGSESQGKVSAYERINGAIGKAPDQPEQPIQNTGIQSPGSQRSKKQKQAQVDKEASKRVNGVKSGIANLYGDGVLEKEYEESDGNYLTSTRSPKGYQTALAQDEKEKTRAKSDRTSKDELVSGRQAGSGWSSSPIRWAPLNVPLQRRLQTLAVLCHTLSIVGLLTVFFLLCAMPLLWPLLIPYLLYTLFSQASTSGQLSRRSHRFRCLPIWSLFASYFPARLHRSQVLAPTRKYIFGYHPHGIISHGAFAAFGTEALGFSQLFPGITNTLLTLDSNFRIPMYREYALSLGLASVSRESCENLLSRGGINKEGMGRAITIVVGGARESLAGQPHSLKIVLKRRKGFVKLAIRTGADLVPTIGFGENELYDQATAESHPLIHKTQLLVKKFLGFTVPLFHARGVFNYDAGFLPYRRPMNIVVGRPIQVEQRSKPDEKYIDEVHERYMKELVRVWDEWKDTFAQDRKEELQIIE